MSLAFALDKNIEAGICSTEVNIKTFCCNSFLEIAIEILNSTSKLVIRLNFIGSMCKTADQFLNPACRPECICHANT